MKRLLIGMAALGCLIGATGCTGKFNLTRGLWTWHRNFESKWTDETFFLILNVTAVYPVAILFDTFIFNVVEFWDDGNNPIRDPDASAKTIEADDGSLITLLNNEDGSLTVSTTSGSYSLMRGEDGVVATDASGKTLYTSKRVEQQVEVRDANGGVKAFDL